jgi:spore germination cell wall hydrolase CwlJ-like protein
MKKIFNLYVSLILVLDLSDAARPRVNPEDDQLPVNLAGLNCDRKMKDPLSCMTCQIYFESRGEPRRGQLAVAKVTLKRANNNRNYVCAKVFEKKKKVCQFSWACDGKRHVMRNVAATKIAVQMARQAFEEGPDSYDHFYATYIEQPVWAQSMSCKRIGRHIFCNGVSVAGYKKVPAPVSSVAMYDNIAGL